MPKHGPLLALFPPAGDVRGQFIQTIWENCAKRRVFFCGGLWNTDKSATASEGVTHKGNGWFGAKLQLLCTLSLSPLALGGISTETHYFRPSWGFITLWCIFVQLQRQQELFSLSSWMCTLRNAATYFQEDALYCESSLSVFHVGQLSKNHFTLTAKRKLGELLFFSQNSVTSLQIQIKS